MGYRTDFVINIEDGDATAQEIENISELLETFEHFEFWSDEWMAIQIKWYDYGEDMVKLSKTFPHLRFYVHGDGDDSDDLWEDHWQAGKYQHCYAIIPGYDADAMCDYNGPLQT